MKAYPKEFHMQCWKSLPIFLIVLLAVAQVTMAADTPSDDGNKLLRDCTTALLHRDVAGDLHHPDLSGMWGHPRDVDLHYRTVF